MAKKFLPLVQIIFLTAGVALWQAFYQFIEEADTRFVMNLGRYVLEHGIPHVDPFTVHENLQLVAQQWLSGVFFWEAYKNFGVEGLLAVDYIFGAAAVLIYWRLCLFVSGNKILSLAMAFAVGLLIAPAIVPRPHIISAPFFVAEIFLLEKFTRTGSAKFLLPLPLISVALINLHAAVWAMSIIFCAPFLFVKNLRHVKLLSAAMVAIFFCGLINPYGLDAMTYVVRSYGVTIINNNIPEMQTLTAHVFRGKIFYATEALIIFSLARCKVPWRFVLLSGGLIYLSLMHQRNIMLFYLLATVALADAWKNFSPEKIFSPDDENYSNRGAMLLIFFLLLFVNTIVVTLTISDAFDKLPAPIKIFFAAATLFMIYTVLAVKLNGRILHPKILPRKNLSLMIAAIIVCGIFSATLDETSKSPPKTLTRAIEFILRDESPENVRLYVDQGGGGLAGEFGIKYYIDSRSEVFLKVNNGRADIFAEYVDFKSGKINYREFFARYKFTHIILTSETPFLFDEMSADKNFRVIYESERVDGSEVVRCKVFVPKELHQ